jgi:hypothetical protein
LLTACLIALLPAAPADAQITVVATSGERSPDNSGDLSEFENPVIQSQGESFFNATVRENGFLQSSDLFRATTGGQLTLLVKQGDPAPDGNGNYPSFSGEIPFVNELGQVAFGITFENTLGNGIDGAALLIGRGGANPLTIAARANQLIPGSGGDRFDLILNPFAFNNEGQVAFTSLTQDSELIGIWRAGAGGIVRIVWQGDANPTGDGILFGGASVPGVNVMNERGEVAFFDYTEVGGDFFGAIYRGDRFDNLVEIVREGDLTPTGNGTYDAFDALLFPHLDLNDQGEVAFVAVLDGTSGGVTDNRALFLGNGQSTAELVRKGDPMPDGNGSFFDIAQLAHIVLNNRGEVLFGSRVTGASGGADEGLFIASRNGVRQVARLGAPAPGGGTFSSFSNILALNNNGLAVFRAFVDIGQPSSDVGLFLYDGNTVRTVIREGDNIPGFGTVLSVVTSTGLEGEGRAERTFLNDLGQVTFNFHASGGSGVAVRTPTSFVFANGFESGNLSAWSLVVGGS